MMTQAGWDTSSLLPPSRLGETGRVVCPLHHTTVSEKEGEAVFLHACLVPGLLAALTGVARRAA